MCIFVFVDHSSSVGSILRFFTFTFLLTLLFLFLFLGANAAMSDLHALFGYLEAMGSLPHVSFDLSLARGLDYILVSSTKWCLWTGQLK